MYWLYLFYSCLFMGVMSIPIDIIRYKYEVKMMEAGLICKSDCWFKFEENKEPHWDQTGHFAMWVILFTFYPISLTLELLYNSTIGIGVIGTKIANKKIKQKQIEEEQKRIQIELNADAEKAKYELGMNDRQL